MILDLQKIWHKIIQFSFRMCTRKPPLQNTYVCFRHNSPPVGQDLLIHEVSRSHTTYNDESHSVGPFWTSDQLVAKTSSWQHTTLTTDNYTHGRIRTHILSRRAAENLRLRPRGHWYQHNTYVISVIYRGVFRPRQTRQLPRAVDLKGRLLSCQSY